MGTPTFKPDTFPYNDSPGNGPTRTDGLLLGIENTTINVPPTTEADFGAAAPKLRGQVTPYLADTDMVDTNTIQYEVFAGDF